MVNDWAVGAVALAWVPGSTLALGGADWCMIGKVARLFEVPNYNKEKIHGVIGGCTVGRYAAEVLSFIPFFGGAVKSAVAAGLTKAIGGAVITHFREQSRLS